MTFRSKQTDTTRAPLVPVVFHEERAIAFIEQLIRHYRKRQGLFASVHHELEGVSVQRRFAPLHLKLGTQAHANWLTIVNYFDTMSQSYQVHGAFWRHMMQSHLWEGEPGVLFRPEVLELSVKDIWAIIKDIGLSFPNEKARRFHRFVRHYYGELYGDPLMIFQLGNSIGEVVRYQKQWARQHQGQGVFLPGYGPKLLSLLALYFYEFGIHDELFPGAYPADRHVQRQLIQSGVVELNSSESGTDAARHVAEIVRLQLIPLLRRLDVTALEFSHAQWLLGNRLCANCHLDIARGRTGHLAHGCPLWEKGKYHGPCIGGRGTADYHKTGRWQDEQPKQSAESTNLVQLELFED